MTTIELHPAVWANCDACGTALWSPVFDQPMSPEELKDFRALAGEGARSLMFPQNLECSVCHAVFECDLSQLGVRF